ncbi:MAG: hypothetical protein KDC57_23565 [Saprospiraceae bacterium]|nr:hypothetical protein [Saprospiraceae bacterium]
MKRFLFLILSILGAFPGWSQRGAMTFSVTKFELADSLARSLDTLESRSGLPLENMFKNVKFNVYFKPDFTRSEVNVLNGIIKLNYFWDRKSKEVMLFSDVFGRRTKVKMDPVDVEELRSEDIPRNELNIQRFPEDKKTIMGLPVYRVHVSPGDRDDFGMDLYVCPDLKIPFVGYGIEQVSTELLGGTPLSYQFNQGVMSIQFELTGLENHVDDKVFRFPGGYTEKTMDEYLNEFGSFIH